MNLLSSLQNNIIRAIAAIFDLDDAKTTTIRLDLNIDKPREFGDLNCNAAMVLAKELQKAPIQIAQEIKAAIKQNEALTPQIQSIEIAGPGFINITLTDEAWQAIAQELYLSPKHYFAPTPQATKKYLLEFVSANPTGPLHLGHGRNAIIGDVLARIIRYLGHTADTEFYINDAGAQMIRLGQSLKIRCQQELGQSVELPDDGYAGTYLIDLAKELVAQHSARGGVQILENKIEFFTNYAKEKMLELQQETLKNYGVIFQRWFSEKELHKHNAIENALAALQERGLLYEKEGALWFESTKFGDDKDRVIKKADGSYTYIAADIAYHKDKFERGYDILIDILGQDHHGYVVRLKATMEALGYDPNNFDVILYQLVSIKQSGEKMRMSKRAGRFEKLSDIIKQVGTDVARFFYLNRKADAHLDFDIDVALKKTEENPVYYIQYGYVRTKSLIEKATQVSQFKDFLQACDDKAIVKNIIKKATTNISNNEIEIIKKICSLKEILAAIVTNNQTHLLTYYTLEIAKHFHNYYAHNKIIDAEDIQTSQSRLFLTKLVRQTLATCLDLLGLSKPEKM